MRSALTALLVSLRQKLVARAAASVHSVSHRIRVEAAPAFHVVQDHLRTRQLSQPVSTAQLVSPQAKKGALAAASVSLASSKTRPSRRRANYVTLASTGRPMMLHLVVFCAKRDDTKRKRSRLRACRAFLVCFSRRKVRRNVTLASVVNFKMHQETRRAETAQEDG